MNGNYDVHLIWKRTNDESHPYNTQVNEKKEWKESAKQIKCTFIEEV